MKLTMLGTGNAMVTECYNTCFALTEGGEHFLVDGGGGGTILRQLKHADMDWKDIHHIFITHKHVDHLLGLVYLVRVICQNMKQGKYEGEAFIYGHAEVLSMLEEIARLLLQENQTKFIGDRLHLVVVRDGESCEILGHKVTFFDIHSTKARQFGFSLMLDETEKLTCCGDEPYNDFEEVYAKDSKWLLHEAFCLCRQADVFKPYEKHHSTVKEACETAKKLNVKNLILYHTEDKNILRRKELYTEEGRQFYDGNLYVPEDFEWFEL